MLTMCRQLKAISNPESKVTENIKLFQGLL